MDKNIVEKCAKICERKWWRLSPSCIDIDPESHEPLSKNISQRDLFSFINDIMKLRANEIRKLAIE